MKIQKTNKSKLTSMVWLYTKYQLITKGLLMLIVFPISSFILNILLRSTGRTNISSGDYIQFLFSFQGLGMLILGLILLIILIGIDINAFIIMSALIREDKVQMNARSMLRIGIKSLKSFLKPSGILIVLYVAIIVPLVGVGISISPMTGFQIPNFITDVIFNNKLYNFLYTILMVFLTFISFKYIFFFHYVLISQNKINTALKNASELMKRHWKSFIKDFIVSVLKFLMPFVIFLILYGLASYLLYLVIPSTLIDTRSWTILSVIVFSELLAMLALMMVPIFCDRLTYMFYKYNEEDGNTINFDVKVKNPLTDENIKTQDNRRNKKLITICLSMVMIVNLIVAIVSNKYFDEIFKTNKKIEIVAHRAGGNLGAENSIYGLQQAIAHGATWSEIDVQRTKDNKYIINHDTTFKRVTGNPKTSSEMTLDEIKQLKIKDLFDSTRPSQEVATIEEFLDVAKGKIGLFIELKGKTADEKMVDDIVQMIKERNMEKEAAILSLDYPIIEYTEEKYPEILTGFLYFFSIGNTAKMKGDMLIMEELEASPEKIEEIHAANKKAIVWTVNTNESINQFVKSQVDGIITDYVLDLQAGIERRDNRTDLKIIIDYFLGQ